MIQPDITAQVEAEDEASLGKQLILEVLICFAYPYLSFHTKHFGDIQITL